MNSIIGRFVGEENENRLLGELCRQAVVQGDETLAREIAAQLELMELEPGVEFITQGDAADDIFFILSGRVSVVINGREVAVRGNGVHVGEMALLDPSARRAASVATIERTVVGKVKERAFAEIAQRNPSLWRKLALFLGERLRQRSQFVSQRNPRPVIFIGSSSEALSIAYTVKSELEKTDCLVRIWTDNVFIASSFAIVDLEDQIRTADFAILVMTPDDTVTSRERSAGAPRDNVIFELGLFMGAITHSRTFLLIPNGVEVKIPSDLLGLKPLIYDLEASAGSHTSLNAVIDEISRVVGVLGTK